MRKLEVTEVEAIIVRATGNRDIYVLELTEDGTWRPASWTKGHATINRK